MNLRTQLKNTKMQKGETIRDYFSRVSQFNEQLEEIGDNLDEYELIITSLDGLTIPWDAFIQAHLLVSSYLIFEHFQFLVIFPPPGQDVCKHQAC